jgi:hypothetical protein
VVVRAIGESGMPVSGAAVVLGHARAGEADVRELSAHTNEQGEARFTNLDTTPTSGYLLKATKEGASFVGKPFRLSANMGAQITLTMHLLSTDLSALRIGSGSHLVLGITDDAVQVAEVWRLSNSATSAIDPGPQGLVLPLPDRALSPQAGPSAPPSLTVAGTQAVWHGPIQPGDTELQVVFVIPFAGDSLTITQRTPLPLDELAVVTDRIDGLVVAGDQLQAEDRELQGRKLVLYRGPGVAAGGEWRLQLRGLPHADPTWRLVASSLSALILIGFAVLAVRGGGGAARSQLAMRRAQLLQELAALDVDGGTAAAHAQRRARLTAQLVAVYRDLDEIQ